MKIIEKLRERSNQKNRLKGQAHTLLATGCAIVITLGVVTNPVGIIALTLAGTFFGSEAFKRALKMKR